MAVFLKHVCLMVVFVVGCNIYAQDYDRLYDKYYHVIRDDEGNLAESEAFSDQINDLLQSPVNLNAADADEIRRIFFLSEFQVLSIIDYRKRYGNLISLFELVYVYGFDAELVKELEPFVVLKDYVHPRRRTYISSYPHELLMRNQLKIQQQKGYRPVADSILFANPDYNRYMGKRVKNYIRYNFSPNKFFSAMLKAEKDAGEPMFSNKNRYGFDFYSGYLSVARLGIVERIIIGDYSFTSGQGVSFSTGGFYASGNASNINQRSQVLKPYRSVGEVGFMRGIAIQTKKGDFSNYLFFSNTRRDANITGADTTTSGILYYSSLQSTGLHSTPGEMADKRVLREQCLGTYLVYRKTFFQLGFSTVYQYYGGQYLNNTYNPAFTIPKRIFIAGADYKWRINQLFLFAELAMHHHWLSVIQGAELHPLSGVVITFAYRNLNSYLRTNYQHLNFPVSNTNPQEGFYVGCNIRVARLWQFQFYNDYYRQKSYGFQQSMPLRVNRLHAGALYSSGRRFMLKFNITNKTQEVKRLNENGAKYVYVPENICRMKTSLTYSFRKNISYKSDIQQVYANFNTWAGSFSMGHHLKLVSGNNKLVLKAGTFIFDAGLYTQRLYQYEPDVLYAFSPVMLYGQGVRSYTMLRYKFTESVRVWLKYNSTTYENVHSVGSGLASIDGDVVSEIKMQIIARF